MGMGRIIDAMVQPEAAAVPLSVVLGALSGVFVLGSATTLARTAWMAEATARIAAKLRQRLFDGVLARDVQFFDRYRVGDLVSRLSDDAGVVAKAATENLAQGVKRLLEGAGGLAILMWITPELTSVLALVLPPIALGGWAYGRYVKRLSRALQDRLGEATQFAEERLANVRTVRLFTQEPADADAYRLRTDAVRGLARRVGAAGGAFYASLSLTTNFALLGVMAYGGSLVTSGSMTVGDLSSFLLYSVYVGVALSGGASLYSDLMKGVGAGGRIFEILDSKDDFRTAVPRLAAVLDPFAGDAPCSIEFRDVVFRYPTRNRDVLRGLNLSVAAGSCVALVGTSGSGKSTVASLVARLYDPDSGAVLVNGVDVRDVDPRQLRAHIGFVPQEPALFHESVARNIAYGGVGDAVSREDVEAAARMAGADEFVRGFPEQYDTLVGERGTTLSGGQKQRVAIARAFVRNPRIFVLDEATSALDAVSERAVHDALERIKRGRTTLIVAHRLSTIRMADRIVVLGDGRVLEEGTHAELMLIRGAYYDLVQQQQDEHKYHGGA
jgi:ATP-binding cassette subfamily B (MDR/TAP) protein 10